MIKRILSLLIIFCLLLSTVACTSERDTEDASLRVLVTSFPAYDITREIMRDVPETLLLEMLTPLESESHDFEPSMGDVARIAECDLLITVGGDTDAWVDSAVAATGRDVNTLRLIDCAPLLEVDESVAVSSHEHEHEEECEHEHEIDEHVWTSPANAALIARRIERELLALLPEHADAISLGADTLCAELDALMLELHEVAGSAARRTLIFADRFPFRYLASELALECHAAFDGCSSNSEPSLTAIYELTELARRSSAPVILVTEFADHLSADVIASATGAEVLTLHSCHNVSRRDFDAGEGYVSLMRRNIDVLRMALGTEN